MKTAASSLINMLLFVTLALSASLISKPLSPTLFASLIANDTIPSSHDIAFFNLTTLVQLDYHVPGTTLVLHFVLSLRDPIDRLALGRTILTAQQPLHRLPTHRLNAYLAPEDDPYEVDDRRSGKCMIGMKSAKKGSEGDERLTYKRVLDTFQGVYGALYMGRRCYSGIFQVDDGVEIVGTGKVVVGNVPVLRDVEEA
ncbi:MAG: hypothetical protein Q9218_005513 [Villophora microphyllina]